MPSPSVRASVVWFLAALTFASPAMAEESEPPALPTMGVYVDGLASKDVREDLNEQAGRFFKVAPPGDLTAALWKAGFGRGVWRALSKVDARKRALPAFHSAAVLSHTDAILVATAWDVPGAEQHVVLLVMRTSGGDPILDVELTFPREEPHEVRAARIGATLEKPLRRLQEELGVSQVQAVTPAAPVEEAPPAPTSPAAPPPSLPEGPVTPNTIDALERSLLGGDALPPREEPAPTPAPPAGPRGKSPGLAVALGLDTGTRLFRHDEATTAEHRVYRAAPILGYALSLEVKPLGSGQRLDLSAIADYGHSLGLKSQTIQGGPSFATSTYRYGLTLRLGIHTGQQPTSPLLALFGGYGAQTYRFDRDAAPDDEVPLANYKMLRVGFHTRVPVRLAALIAQVSYAGVFSIDPLGARTPTRGANGFEALAGIAIPWSRFFETRLVGSYALYDFHLWPLPERADAAGHVRDQYTRVALEAVVGF